MSVSASVSSIAPGTTPSSVGCLPNSAPTLRNVTGLSGHICQVNYAPDVLDIASCCKMEAEVRVQDNCTQYCEVDADGADEWRDCVVDKLDDDPVSSVAAFCQVLNQTESSSISGPSSTSGASGTPTPNTTQSGDPPQDTGSASTFGHYSIAFTAVAAAVVYRLSTLW